MAISNARADIWASLGVGVVVGGAGAAAIAVAALANMTSSAMIAPVAIVLACLVSVGHYWKTLQARSSMDQFRSTRQRFDDLEQGIKETQGLVQLTNVALPYPLPFGGKYALTADAAAVLARQIVLLRPAIVLELGSGISTVLIGKLLQDLGGGRVLSVEHDPAWAAETRKQIKAAGLEPYAVVLDAPLRKQDLNGQERVWYDTAAIFGELHSPVDLLVVDGPPQRIDPEGLPRYPALPRLLPYLSERAEIFVDDANRPPEQETVRLWLERFPGWQARMYPTVPGTCLLSRTTCAESAVSST